MQGDYGLYTLTQERVVLIWGLDHNSAVLAGLADRLARASVEPGCEQGPAVAGQRIGKVSATSWV